MKNEWVVVGELVRRRRERLGLKQDELKARGGPGVATVGKIERAAQDGFPLRTQHQLERALGWSLGLIEEVIADVAEKRATAEDWADETVGAAVPDLSETPATTDGLQDLEARLRALELRVARLEVEGTESVTAKVIGMGYTGPGADLAEALDDLEDERDDPQPIRGRSLKDAARREDD